MIRAATIAVLLGTIAGAGRAAELVTPCNVDGAVTRIILDQSKQAVTMAGAQVALAAKIRPILSALPHSNLPFSKVATPEQAAAYADYSAKKFAIDLNELVDSDLARDAEVLGELHSIAWAVYNDREARLDLKNIGQVAYYLLLQASGHPKVSSFDARPAGCSLDATLATEQFDAKDRSDAADASTTNGLSIMIGLVDKYPKPFDIAKLTASDRNQYDAAQEELAMMRRETRLSEDLENMRAYWAMAELVHQDREEDLRVYGPSVESIGNTIETKIPNFTSIQKIVFALWRFVDQKEPSQKLREMGEIGNIVKTGKLN